jgi:tetratricopeptide (TPR) repeat protein
MNQMPMEKKELLNSLSDELITISFEVEESKRMAVEEAMHEIWSEGQTLLRSKEYDQAIEVFSTLLETTYAERANDKIVEASQLAAQEDRRKAAELFVRATKTNDQESRVALLLQSRELLKGILQKYQQSGLVEKAERNLRRIEQEIMVIDPSLLIEPEVSAEEEDDDDKIFQQPMETTINGTPLRNWKEKVPTSSPQE